MAIITQQIVQITIIYWMAGIHTRVKTLIFYSMKELLKSTHLNPRPQQ